MVKYETSEEILDRFFNPKKYLEIAQKELKNKEKMLEKANEKVERGILLMLNQRIPLEIIAKTFEVSIEQIQTIQAKYKDKNPLKEFLNGATDNG